MTAPRHVLIAIAEAVEAQGGDIDDVRDLVEVWERVGADTGPRVGAMRREAANPRCCCADGGAPASDGRCGRCYGLIPEPGR
jgi:hypothetical protein